MSNIAKSFNKIKIFNDNRHTKTNEELSLILNTKEYNDIIINIHDVISKNILWKEKNIQDLDIYKFFINIYILENKGESVFEWYGIKEQKFLLVIKKLLESFNNIINNDNLELSIYINNLYECIELYNEWKSKYKYRMSEYYINIFKYIVNIFNNSNTSELKKKYLLVKSTIIYKHLEERMSDVIEKLNSNHEILFLKKVKDIENTDFMNLIEKSDLKIYHEISLNKNYKLPFDEYNYWMEIDIPTKIEQIEKNMKEDPPYFGWLLYYLKYVKNIININNIIPLSVKNIILNLINEKDIIYKIENELSYNLEECKIYFTEITNNIIINILPFIKHEIKNIDKSEKLYYNYIHIYIICKYLEIESENQKLIKLSLYKDLEKNYFDEHYKKMDRTNKWIKIELDQVNSDLLKCISKNTDNIHNIFMSEIIIKYTIHCGDYFPETLILDLEKIFELSQQFNKYVFISLNIYYIYEGINFDKDIINQIEDLLIKELLDININNIKSIDIYKIISPIINNTKIKKYINKSFKDTKIKKYITEKIFYIWANVIKEISIDTTIIDKYLIKLIPEIQKSAEILKEIININIQVHGERYSKIIKNCI